MQQLTLFDFVPVGNEIPVKKIISNKINSIEEKRLKDAFGFSLANVLFNEMTDYTSLYDLDTDERTIFGTRLQKTLEKHCDIEKGEICDYNIEGFEVELKTLTQRIRKNEDGTKILMDTYRGGHVGSRQIGHHGLLCLYKEKGIHSYLHFVYHKLDLENLGEGLNSNGRRITKEKHIRENMKKNSIRELKINRFDYINKKYKN